MEEEQQGETIDEQPAAPPPEIGREDLMMLLMSVPERIADLVAGLDESRLRYRHGPAFPTAGEAAAHVASAGLLLDPFITAVSFEDGPPPALGMVLEPPTPAEPGPVGEMLADWQRVRRRGVDLLRGLAGERWEMVLDDPLRGELTVEEGLRLVLKHEMGHLAQLRNLTALVPEMLTPAEGANHA